MAEPRTNRNPLAGINGWQNRILTDDVHDVNAGRPISATNGGGTYPWSMEPHLGRVNYNYDNQLFH